MDRINTSCIIESKDLDYVSERESKSKYDLLAQMIHDTMTKEFGSLEESYPYIVKFLFAGKAMDKAVHKQMFWRVYGDIALRNIKANLENYKVCEKCNTKYPSWTDEHVCAKETKGFFTCVDCNKRYPQMNSKQRRCEQCQDVYRHLTESIRKKNRYNKIKEEKEQRKEQRIGFLASPSEKT